jgi:hypothetical protein
MKEFTNRALAAVFALSLICGSASVALADRGGNGQANANANAHAKVPTSVHGKSATRGNSASHTNSSNRPNGAVPVSSSARGNSATAHSCINPAGKTRGWCKSHGGGDFMTGTVTSINGNLATVMLSNGQSVTVNASGLTIGQHVTLRGSFQNGAFVPNGQPLSNYGGPYSTASVRGLIISVNGNSVQVVQGLSLITIDDSDAAARGAINGALVPGRTITAYGTWNGSTFVATSIQ